MFSAKLISRIDEITHLDLGLATQLADSQISHVTAPLIDANPFFGSVFLCLTYVVQT